MEGRVRVREGRAGLGLCKDRMIRIRFRKGSWGHEWVSDETIRYERRRDERRREERRIDPPT